MITMIMINNSNNNNNLGGCLVAHPARTARFRITGFLPQPPGDPSTLIFTGSGTWLRNIFQGLGPERQIMCWKSSCRAMAGRLR